MDIKITPYNSNSMGLITAALQFMKKNSLPEDKSKMREFFNKRTAEQILKDGYITGCHDDAVIFTTLCRNSGLETRYVETFAKKWLESPMSEQMIAGHSFVEVAGVLVDPSRKTIFIDPSYIDLSWVVAGKEKEVVDFGYDSYESLIQKSMDFKERYRKENRILETAL